MLTNEVESWTKRRHSISSHLQTDPSHGGGVVGNFSGGGEGGGGEEGGKKPQNNEMALELKFQINFKKSDKWVPIPRIFV